MKKIVIYTTNDKVISLKLVDEIISSNYFDDYQIDILLTKASFFFTKALKSEDLPTLGFPIINTFRSSL